MDTRLSFKEHFSRGSSEGIQSGTSARWHYAKHRETETADAIPPLVSGDLCNSLRSANLG